MHKLTVRLDASVWADLQRVCEVNAVSVTAFIQACVMSSIREHSRHGWLPLDQWEDHPEYALIVTDARTVDAKRRNRGGSDGA